MIQVSSLFVDAWVWKARMQDVYKLLKIYLLGITTIQCMRLRKILLRLHL
jgi:hypothetical protein